jgi:hypothetical protein
MKSFRATLTLCSLAVMLSARAAVGIEASAPEDFFGIKWGASKEELKSAMKEKHTNTMPRFTTENRLAFSGGAAAGFPIQYWDLLFGQDKLWRGKITFAESGDVELFFKQIKKMLTEKYSTRQSESFKPGEPTADWKLQNPETKDSVTIHLFTEGRNKQKRLCLEYVNEVLKAKYPASLDTVAPSPGKSNDNGF